MTDVAMIATITISRLRLPWKKRRKGKQQIETPFVDQCPGHAREKLRNVCAIEWRDRQKAKCEIPTAFAEQDVQRLADDKPGRHQTYERRHDMRKQ